MTHPTSLLAPFDDTPRFAQLELGSRETDAALVAACVALYRRTFPRLSKRFLRRVALDDGVVSMLLSTAADAAAPHAGDSARPGKGTGHGGIIGTDDLGTGVDEGGGASTEAGARAKVSRSARPSEPTASDAAPPGSLGAADLVIPYDVGEAVGDVGLGVVPARDDGSDEDGTGAAGGASTGSGIMDEADCDPERDDVLLPDSEDDDSSDDESTDSEEAGDKGAAAVAPRGLETADLEGRSLAAASRLAAICSFRLVRLPSPLAAATTGGSTRGDGEGDADSDGSGGGAAGDGIDADYLRSAVDALDTPMHTHYRATQGAPARGKNAAYVMHVLLVAVRPALQARGVGRDLVRRLVEHARVANCSSVVVHADPSARGFFAACGFDGDRILNSRFRSLPSFLARTSTLSLHLWPSVSLLLRATSHAGLDGEDAAHRRAAALARVARGDDVTAGIEAWKAAKVAAYSQELGLLGALRDEIVELRGDVTAADGQATLLAAECMELRARAAKAEQQLAAVRAREAARLEDSGLPAAGGRCADGDDATCALDEVDGAWPTFAYDGRIGRRLPRPCREFRDAESWIAAAGLRLLQAVAVQPRSAEAGSFHAACAVVAAESGRGDVSRLFFGASHQRLQSVALRGFSAAADSSNPRTLFFRNPGDALRCSQNCGNDNLVLAVRVALGRVHASTLKTGQDGARAPIIERGFHSAVHAIHADTGATQGYIVREPASALPDTLLWCSEVRQSHSVTSRAADKK